MARANPQDLLCLPGSGLPAHLMMEVFKSAMASTWCTCPTRAMRRSATGRGAVSLMFTSVGVALRSPKAGASASSAGAAKRAARTPTSRAFIESGVKDFNVGTWFAMLRREGRRARSARTLRRHRGALEGRGGRAHAENRE